MKFFIPVAILTENMLYKQMLSGNYPNRPFYLLAFRTEEEMRDYIKTIPGAEGEVQFLVLQVEKAPTTDPSRN